MGFRKTQTIKRTAAGIYVDGIFQPGAESTLTIQASIQPVTLEDQVTMPEGRRLSDYVKAYTSSDLQVLGEVVGLQPDKLVWRGHEYECISSGVFQMDVVSHFKYIFSKVTQ